MILKVGVAAPVHLEGRARCPGVQQHGGVGLPQDGAREADTRGLVPHHPRARPWSHPGAEARRRHLYALVKSLGTT